MIGDLRICDFGLGMMFRRNHEFTNWQFTNWPNYTSRLNNTFVSTAHTIVKVARKTQSA